MGSRGDNATDPAEPASPWSRSTGVSASPPDDEVGSDETTLGSPAAVLVFLNALGVGEMDRIAERLDQARRACAGLGHEDLAEKLAEASAALEQGDLRTYRKRVETVVARLGHLR